MWGEIMAKRKMNATIYDVAELANVSLATASRVINGIDKVSEDTKQRVLEAIAELNYKPNTIAKSLASRKTTDVAIIVPEINYSYVAHTVAGLIDSAKKYGYDCLIFTTKGSKKDISETFEKVLSLRVNGVIIFNDHLGESELKELLNFDVPVVCLATSIKDVSCVTFHYKDQVRTIVEECLNIKHKDVYFLSVEGHGMIEERILKAVKEAYMEKNIVFENIIHIPDSYSASYPILFEHFKKVKKGYYIAARDSIAISALNAAKDNNIDVPNDVELMAVIGTKYSELSRPRLSSFNINMRNLGNKGMEVLARLIENKNQVIVEKLSFEFVKRETTL